VSKESLVNKVQKVILDHKESVESKDLQALMVLQVEMEKTEEMVRTESEALLDEMAKMGFQDP
jgi:hypothetical protein